jgi:hypothetical protein
MVFSEHEMALVNNQDVTIKLISNNAASNAQPLKVAEKLVKVRSKKTVKHEDSRKPELLIQNGQTYPLDLSIPFKANEKFDLEKKFLIPHEALNVFAVNPNKKARSLELNGDLLMSPDPQPEKRKSLDGAGIIINLKP